MDRKTAQALIEDHQHALAHSVWRDPERMRVCQYELFRHLIRHDEGYLIILIDTIVDQGDRCVLRMLEKVVGYGHPKE